MLVVFAGVLASTGVSAQAEKYLSGVHYTEIARPIPIDADDGQTGEVWVFFKYTCPACYQFHPYVEAWQSRQVEGIVVRNIPVFQPELYSRVYYAADALNLDDQFHLDIYRKIHQEQQPLHQLQEFAELAAAHGVDAQEFTDMANSFSVSTKVSQGTRIAGQAQVPGTPIVVVNGKYLLSRKQLGSNAAMLDVAEFLTSNESLQAVE